MLRSFYLSELRRKYEKRKDTTLHSTGYDEYVYQSERKTENFLNRKSNPSIKEKEKVMILKKGERSNLVNVVRFKEEVESQEGGEMSFNSTSVLLGTKFSLVRIVAKIRE